MIEVNGKPVMASVDEILFKLRDDAFIAGLPIFSKFKNSGNDNIMTNCPFHKFGQERKPSFGISTVNGYCHCFACGWSGRLEKMVSSIFGYEDEGRYGSAWISRQFLSFGIESRQALKTVPNRRCERLRGMYDGFTEDELQNYRYIHPYMYERGLTDELIDKFDIGYDSAFSLKDKDGKIISTFPCITFPVYDENNNPAFIARRAINSKLFHYPESSSKPVYGANVVIANKCRTVIICESIFNCLTCWKYGKPAVALLGTGTNEQMKILEALPVRKYILGLDPDEAGRKATKKIYGHLVARRLVTFLKIPNGKDLNDLDSKILDLEEYF